MQLVGVRTTWNLQEEMWSVMFSDKIMIQDSLRTWYLILNYYSWFAENSISDFHCLQQTRQCNGRSASSLWAFIFCTLRIVVKIVEYISSLVPGGKISIEMIFCRGICTVYELCFKMAISPTSSPSCFKISSPLQTTWQDQGARHPQGCRQACHGRWPCVEHIWWNGQVHRQSRQSFHSVFDIV